MERHVEDWTIEKLHQERSRITFPEYQREPRLWPTERKARLIDSILQDIDIPKLYFYKVPTTNNVSPEGMETSGEEDAYEVVDGQQRLWAIWDFIDGNYTHDGKKFAELPEGQPDVIRSYELQITVLEETNGDETSDEYLREMFLRLQLGMPLNMGEKLNALSGEMKELVFNVLPPLDFVDQLGIPRRRFARETLCAQICINSFARASSGSFARTRFEDLQYFFQKYERPSGTDRALFDERAEKIANNLKGLWDCFGRDASRLRNRSYILSVYLFFEELEKASEISEDVQKKHFAQFVLTLWDSLKGEAKKGINRTDEGLYQFETYLSSAPGEKYQIERRHERLRRYYEHFNATGGVKGLPVSVEKEE